MASASPHPALGFVSRLAGQAVNNMFFFGLQLAARMLLFIALGRSLSPEDYGIYALIVTTIMFAGNLLRLGAHQYYEREVPGRPQAEAQALLKSILGVQTALLLGLAIAALMIPGARVAAMRVLHGQGASPLLFLAAGILICDISATEFARYLAVRAEIERSNLVGFLQSAAWGLGVFTLFAVTPTRVTLMGVLGLWLAGAIGGVALGAAFTGFRGLWRAPLSPSVYVTAVRFGWPLMLTNLSSAVISWSDRYFISLFHSTREVGVYAYQYGLVAMVTTLSAPLISSVLDPHVLAAHNRGDLEACRRLLNASVRYSLLLTGVMLVALSLWGRQLIARLASSDYLGPGGLILALLPVPVLSVLRSGVERVLFLERRPDMICRCYLGAAAVSLALNALLVPIHPYYGPAFTAGATLLTQVSLLWFVGRSSVVQVQAGRVLRGPSSSEAEVLSQLVGRCWRREAASEVSR